jgi:hypothetical protein
MKPQLLMVCLVKFLGTRASSWVILLWYVRQKYKAEVLRLRLQPCLGNNTSSGRKICTPGRPNKPLSLRVNGFINSMHSERKIKVLFSTSNLLQNH